MFSSKRFIVSSLTFRSSIHFEFIFVYGVRECSNFIHLHVALEKTIIQKDTCTVMFTVALFTIVRTWKQPKRPSTEEWIKKMWYMYTVEYYSAIKKNEIMPPAATWMDLEIVILSEVRQRKTNII